MGKIHNDLDDIKDLNARAREYREAMDRRAQATPSGEHVALAPEELKARKRRNVWIALSIAAFVVLVFFITLAKLQAGVLDRPL